MPQSTTIYVGLDVYRESIAVSYGELTPVYVPKVEDEACATCARRGNWTT